MKVAVLGAGSSLEGYHRDHFKKHYDLVLSTNYVGFDFNVDKIFATHLGVVKNLMSVETYDIHYSKWSSDTGYIDPNPQPGRGVLFLPYTELWVGGSTILPAIHFAAKLSDQVDVFGVDLERHGSVHYYKGYPSENNQMTDAHFDEWARLIRMQIEGLASMLNVKLNFIK